MAGVSSSQSERFKSCDPRSKARKGVVLNNRDLNKLRRAHILESSEISGDGELSSSIYDVEESLDIDDERRRTHAMYRTQNFNNGDCSETTSLNRIPLSKFTIVQNDRCKLVANVLQKFNKKRKRP